MYSTSSVMSRSETRKVKEEASSLTKTSNKETWLWLTNRSLRLKGKKTTVSSLSLTKIAILQTTLACLKKFTMIRSEHASKSPNSKGSKLWGLVTFTEVIRTRFHPKKYSLQTSTRIKRFQSFQLLRSKGFWSTISSEVARVFSFKVWYLSSIIRTPRMLDKIDSQNLTQKTHLQFMRHRTSRRTRKFSSITLLALPRSKRSSPKSNLAFLMMTRQWILKKRLQNQLQKKAIPLTKNEIE